MAWMKRVGLAGALVVAVMAGGALAQGKASLDAVVPADVIMYLEFKDVKGMRAGFEKSMLGQVVQNSELLSAGRDFGLAAGRLGSIFVTGVPIKEFQDILLNDAGLVVFDLEPGAGRAKQPPMAFIAHVGANKQKLADLIEQKVKPRLTAFNPKVKFEPESYGKTSIECLSVPNKPPTYAAFIGDVFAIGPSKTAVQRIADASEGKGQRLADLPAYVTIKERTTLDTGARLYVNADMLIGKVRGDLEQNTKQREGFTALGILNLKGIGASTAFKGEGMYDKFFLHMGGEKVGLARLPSESATKPPRGADFIPEGYHFYVATDFGTGEALRQAVAQFIRDLKGDEPLNKLAQVAQVWEQQMGIRFKDELLDQLGGEMFAALQVQNLGELIASGKKPGPKDLWLVAGVQVKDGQAIKTVITQFIRSEFLARQGITQDSYPYRDIELSVVTLPQNPAVTPAYAVVEGFFLFSLQSETLEKAIDAITSKATLAATPGHKALAEMLSPKSNMRGYVDVKTLASVLLSVASKKGPRQVQPFLPEIATAADRLFPMGLALAGHKDGVVGESYGPISGPFIISTLASVGNLTKSTEGRDAEAARNGMKKVANALKQYQVDNKAYPQSLDQLVPLYLKELPKDPFQPGQMFAYGKSDAGFVLVSPGPDRKLDVDVAAFNLADWKKRTDSRDPVDIAYMKGKVHQYLKGRFPDEQAPDDEGDIVVTGP
ncbi:MAG: hypothetical protein FJ279_11695 [Planctomycetes bacterium]|nr:hypothetical protein [Planctomycetota bacterium]